jgi:CBS domain containing-hemolysin-like protein
MLALEHILDEYGPLLLVLGGVFLAALFNGMETGLYRVNRLRLHLRVDAGHRAASRLVRLLGDMRGTICACLVACNVGMYLATDAVTRMIAGAGWSNDEFTIELLTTVIMTPVFFVFADVLPKSLFAVEADRWTYRVSRILASAYWLLTAVGLIPALKGLSSIILRVVRGREAAAANPFDERQRLRAFLREGAAEGVISGYQEELIDKILALRQTRVRQVMIPLSRAAAVPVDIDSRRFIEELRKHSFSRLPVWEGRPDAIVGIIRVDAVLATEAKALDLRNLMSRELLTLGPETPVSQALIQMQRRRAAMAIVQDSRGRALGVLTMKDLVEEIVGELAAW